MLLPQLLKQEGLVTIMVTVMVMLMMVPDYSEGHTTCTAITTVYNTSVTCLFAEDISQLSFNVQFFFPNTSVDPEMLLVCNRLTSGGLTCHKGSQVLFDEKQKIADRFTLSRPPSLNKLNGGYYQCHAVPSLTERSQFCPLTYKDVLGLAHPESPPTKDGSDTLTIFLVVVAVMVIFLVVAAVITVAVFLWKRQLSVTLWWDKPTTGHRSFRAVEGSEKSDQRRGLTTRIPEGLPQYFYNVGWRDAMKNEENEETNPTSSTGEHVASPSDVTEEACTPMLATTSLQGHQGGSESKAGASVEETKENKAKGKGKGQKVNTGKGEQERAATEEQGEFVEKQGSDLKWYQFYEKAKRKPSRTTTV